MRRPKVFEFVVMVFLVFTQYSGVLNTCAVETKDNVNTRKDANTKISELNPQGNKIAGKSDKKTSLIDNFMISKVSDEDLKNKTDVPSSNLSCMQNAENFEEKKPNIFGSIISKAKDVWNHANQSTKTAIKLFVIWLTAREATGAFYDCVCLYKTKNLRENLKGKTYEERMELFKNFDEIQPYEYSWKHALFCSIENLLFLRSFSGRGVQQAAYMFLSGGRGVCRNIARRRAYTASLCGIDNYLVFETDSDNDAVYHLWNIYKAGDGVYMNENFRKMDIDRHSTTNNYSSEKYWVSENMKGMSSFKPASFINFQTKEDFFTKIKTGQKPIENNIKFMGSFSYCDPNWMKFKLYDPFGILI